MNYIEKQILEIVKFDNIVYSGNVNNIIDSMNDISKHQRIRLNYDWILDYYEL